MSNPHYLKPSNGDLTKINSVKPAEGTGLTSFATDVSIIPIHKLELGTALIIGKSYIIGTKNCIIGTNELDNWN